MRQCSQLLQVVRELEVRVAGRVVEHRQLVVGSMARNSKAPIADKQHNVPYQQVEPAVCQAQAHQVKAVQVARDLQQHLQGQVLHELSHFSAVQWVSVALP